MGFSGCLEILVCYRAVPKPYGAALPSPGPAWGCLPATLKRSCARASAFESGAISRPRADSTGTRTVRGRARSQAVRWHRSSGRRSPAPRGTKAPPRRFATAAVRSASARLWSAPVLRRFGIRGHSPAHRPDRGRGCDVPSPKAAQQRRTPRRRRVLRVPSWCRQVLRWTTRGRGISPGSRDRKNRVERRWEQSTRARHR
jgi:hypothetical protein